MIKRDYTADFINAVINHPSVKEGAEVKDIADLSEVALNLQNFVLVNEYGGFLLIKKMPGLYECHTQFLPEGRGQMAIDAINEGLCYMFLNTDCTRIITKVNVNNKPARMMIGQFFKKRGVIGNHSYYSMDIEDWIESSGDCAVKGQFFHSAIASSIDLTDDSTHNSYIGAALLLTQNNNVYKAQFTYNRWAMMVGYEPITVISEAPLLIKIGPMTIAINNNEVQLCPLH